MVALTARMQHEANYSDEELAKRGLKRLNIDPKRVQMAWVMDFCAQALRNIIIGIGGRMDGFMMQSRFDITVSSELMAILSIAKDLKDLRERIGRVVVAYTKNGEPVTTSDLEVAGAMCAWMRNTINPTLMCTVEYQPCMVHAGPFANIAVGQSSIIGDLLGLKLFDYHVTESGFGADIGFEKFWNVKCRMSGLVPNAVVIVATIRALKMHGGGPKVVPGRPLAPEYSQKNLGLVEKGLENLFHHINVVKKSGAIPIVSINYFHTDTEEELNLVKKSVEQMGVRCAISKHWLLGGEGALELADHVLDACNEDVNFKFLYPLQMPLRERVALIAKEIYGADGVAWTPEAEAKAKEIENNPDMQDFSIMMVKTHLSLSHEPAWKGVPKGWTLPVRDILLFAGAKFVCPCAGTISLMPGTSSNPAFRRVDVDTKTGKVMGLF
jgi:formate--tetrahydrofolate ligase